MQIQKPYHRGELLVQELAGERASAERNGVVIADTIMAGALPFLRQQQMFIVGSRASQGELWASVLFGPKGLLESPDGRALIIRLEPAFVDSLDPLWSNISTDPRMGGLAIDLSTRRRLRINGHVVEQEPGRLTLAVDEAYPNCPKYIQRRFLKPATSAHAVETQSAAGSALTDEVREIIYAADTMFVASANPEGGLDVSHRGGARSFVSVQDEHSLRVPDYLGNSMFNTLGNFSLDPSAGILIVDFAGSRALQLTGHAHVQWERLERAQKRSETGRSWTFSVDRWMLRPLRQYEWEFLDYSPFNP